MYKLIRFFNQNRRKIIGIILIIVLIIAIIQILNNISKNRQNNNPAENNIINNTYPKEIISDKSAISGENISSTKLNTDANVIDKFIKYCNESNMELAYELLTDECKEEMFPTLQDFNNIYYSKIFDGENKSYTIENWIRNIYQVRITADILSSGKLDDSYTKQDYMTIVENNGEYKLNINNYVGRTKLNKKTEYKDITINVISKDIYMDYEIYNISIENNTNDTISLGEINDTKSIYLLDDNKMKYYFYNNELTENQLIVKGKHTNSLKIKFMNSYTSNRNIKNIVFSRLIMNYEKYKNEEDKTNYSDTYQFRVDV